ncbi:MAG: efflux RND transporter periplasmic adaptor subunit [Spirochaetales bacterium]|nr:efflux RND transporter periplasmic adaptor subunit [Spirochaetales bacterium]
MSEKKPIRMKAPVLAALSSLVVMSTAACGAEQKQQTSGLPERVRTVQAIIEEMTPEIRSFGTITYYRKADVSAATSGRIDSITAEEGSAVREGQKLAAVDNVQLLLQKKRTEEQIKQARAGLELARAKLNEGKLQVEARLLSVLIGELDLKRKKIELDDQGRLLKNKEQIYLVGGLSDEGIHSQRMQFDAQKNQYDLVVKNLEMQKIGLRDADIRAAGLPVPVTESERVRALKEVNTQTLGAEVKVAEAGLEAARTELEAVNQLLGETVIRSPVTGLVGMRYLELGERVQPDAKLFTVLDTSRVYAVFPVAESEGAFITEGMKVEITVDALNKAAFNAVIALVSPLVDPQTGNVSVKALLPNGNLALKPGMFTRARIIAGQPRRAVLVPKTCLLKKEGKNGEAFTVVRGRLSLNKLTLGVEKENLVEVVNGLSEGCAVVDSPSPLLKEGQNVEVHND